jgi:UDP-glucuronate 4-epimerase
LGRHRAGGGREAVRRRAVRRAAGVLGLDNFNEYYPSTLKRDRQAQLELNSVHVVDADLNDEAVLKEVMDMCDFTHVLHLAAQAGVRYAAKNPMAYVHSNIAGFVTLLEVIRHLDVMPRLVYASSSSVYGLNTKVPFSEEDRVDRPASLYAATKKSNEMIAHTYNNIYGLSTTGLRFFTVYGPFGRPDMAYFSFANNIMAGKPIKIFQGPGGTELGRDFTYVDDIVAGCIASLDHASANGPGAPFKVYNLGNTHPVNVSDFVGILETHLGKEAKREYVPMPPTGDVLLTHADVSKAMTELGYRPSTPLSVGLGKFVDWYKVYYKGGALHRDQLEYKPA